MVSVQHLHPQYIVNEDGRKTLVVLPVGEFEGLIEDIEDLAAVAERREEASISHEDLVKELKRDGLV